MEIGVEIDLFEEIAKLKKEKNAVILAHYYQDPDIQDIADYIGDSLGLARQAEKTHADMIVFAGVTTMSAPSLIGFLGKSGWKPKCAAQAASTTKGMPNSWATADNLGMFDIVPT